MWIRPQCCIIIPFNAKQSGPFNRDNDIAGSDMYMAFGVKEAEDSRSPAQGDVVVGWINAGTGRGGLDDYFLSGSHTCSDGAESCPDTSKEGGEKNVELLNSVSRDNYTMITFKR